MLLLIIFKVYLAMEAGYSEKVDELCDRYSLKGFVKAKGIILCQSLPFSKQFFLLSICQ